MDGQGKDFTIEGEKLYSIREVARICGVGRTTLLRMEESGFDTPRRIDPETGYRYYDVVNIHRIMQYQMFRKLGLSTTEIADYFNHKLNSQAFLKTLKERLTIAERCVDEFESRFTERESLTFSYSTLPGVTCAAFPCPYSNPKDQIEYNYLEVQRLYNEGFKPFPTTPMFFISPDTSSVYEEKDVSARPTICVAIYPEPIPDPSQVVTFKERLAFSLLYHGNRDEIMAEGGLRLLQEMRRRQIRPTGPLFGICVVGPFFGTQIEPEDYVFRWAIPID